MTTEASTPPGPSFLEKVGGEVLDLIIAEAKAYEPEIIAFANGEIAAGETSASAAITKALASRIPVVGVTIGATIATALASLSVTAEGAAKSGLDAALAALQAEATKLGG